MAHENKDTQRTWLNRFTKHSKTIINTNCCAWNWYRQEGPPKHEINQRRKHDSKSERLQRQTQILNKSKQKHTFELMNVNRRLLITSEKNKATLSVEQLVETQYKPDVTLATELHLSENDDSKTTSIAMTRASEEWLSKVIKYQWKRKRTVSMK